ncbi:MAG: hypothetical protein JRN15_08485, partial [Nitrososphaerota archaeon]|nr:hypothetical protein [Nitrososphaerota archaeon]
MLSKKVVLSLSLLMILSASSLLVSFMLPFSLFPTSQASGSTVAPLNDPYANFTGYQSYLQSFYQPSIGGFRAYPVPETGGGDYNNYWIDDTGKMLTAFSALGDSTYAGLATNFIMNNAINDSGYLYLPERIVNTTDNTYLHVNTSALASPEFPITYTPVQNPSFELENTNVNPPQPSNWTN